jgi:beta-galactosidase/beta-glucuronidase
MRSAWTLKRTVDNAFSQISIEACSTIGYEPITRTKVAAEATQNVQRLQHHRFIVIWVGNNEDYQVRE